MREWKCINFNNGCAVAASAHVLSHADGVAAPACPACRSPLVEVATVVRGGRARRRVRRSASALAVLAVVAAAVWFLVPRTPWIYSSGQASATLGRPFEYQIKAALGPVEYGVELPTGGEAAWASVDPAKGLLTGEPDRPGTVRVTITARNARGTTRKVVRIDVAPSPVQVTSPDQVDAVAGEPFRFTVLATPRPTAFACAAAIPPWLTLDPATGELTGTPQAEGTVVLPLRVDTPAGAATQALTVRVAAADKVPPRLMPIPPFAGETETRVSIRVACTPAAGVEFAADHLPPGLTIDPATGEISGTPMRAGTFTATVRARHVARPALESTASATFTLTAVPRVPVVDAGQEIRGLVRNELRVKLRATHSPDTFEITPPLPDGLTLDPRTGEVGGKVERSVTATVSVRARNAQGWSAAPVPVRIEIEMDQKDVRDARAAIRAAVEQVGYMADNHFLVLRVDQKNRQDRSNDPADRDARLEMQRRMTVSREAAAGRLMELIAEARALPGEAVDAARRDFAGGAGAAAGEFDWLNRNWNRLNTAADAVGLVGELETVGRERARAKGRSVD